MTEQSPNYLPQDPQPAALRLAEFVKRWASAWPEFSGAHKSGMETAAELLRLHAENQALATDFNVARDAYDAARLEIESLQAMLDAVGAGGVEPLRRAKCLHQIVEPQEQPVAYAWYYDSCGHAVTNRLAITETPEPTTFLENVFARGPIPLYTASQPPAVEPVPTPLD